MPKEYYLYVNGQRVKVSEQIYKVYWREREHEKYLEQVDRKNHLLFFSSLDHDGHFVDNIVDETVWLSQPQMAELFKTSRTNIVEHIGNIYDEGELDKNSNLSGFPTGSKRGKS